MSYEFVLLKTFLLSMTPLGELRVAIPYALLQNLNPVLTYVIAVLGNMVPVFFLLWGLPRVEKIITGSLHKTRLQRLYSWYKSRTHRKYSKRFQRMGALALITFVAIPLPITGAWTGTLAAHIFGVPPKKALPLILIGVMIAGAIMTLVTLGIL